MKSKSDSENYSLIVCPLQSAVGELRDIKMPENQILVSPWRLICTTANGF